MHQSFREGFEKISFLFADPKSFKAGLKQLANKGPEAARDLAHAEVSYGSGIKSQITNENNIVAAKKEYDSSKKLKAIYPKGTQHPNAPKFVPNFPAGLPRATKVDQNNARGALQTQTNERGYNRRSATARGQPFGSPSSKALGEITRRDHIKIPGKDPKYIENSSDLPHIISSPKRNTPINRKER